MESNINEILEEVVKKIESIENSKELNIPFADLAEEEAYFLRGIESEEKAMREALQIAFEFYKDQLKVLLLKRYVLYNELQTRVGNDLWPTSNKIRIDLQTKKLYK
jgi:hypothetical protein